MIIWYTDKIENKELGYSLYLDLKGDKEYWYINGRMNLSNNAGEEEVAYYEEGSYILYERTYAPHKVVDIAGNNYNGLVVSGYSHNRGNKHYWDVICSCGEKRKPLRKDSLEKHTGLCTCDRTDSGYKDYTGKVFNKLKILSLNKTENGRSYWNVKCVCGKEYISRSDSMTRNLDGCGSHIRPYCMEGEKVKVDVSTDKHPNTFTYVEKCIHDKFMKSGSWWCIQSKVGGLYVQGMYNGVQTMLHHLVQPLEGGLVVDHIDGDGLNNLPLNLRLVTKEGNARNMSKPSNNTSGHIGVSLLYHGQFRAYITIQDIQEGLGQFSKLEDAIKVRKAAEVKYGFHKNHGRDKIEY